MRDFRRIRAWERAHALAMALHRLARHFGHTGHAHLRSQLTRAGDSIAANIVEGCGAESNKDLARFLEMSVKSANEAEYHLLSARDLSLISPKEWQTHTAETVAVRKMVYVYRRKVLSSSRDPHSADD